MRALLRAVALFLALTGAALAGPFEDAVEASNRGDYATALRLFRPLAEQGGVAAQYNLGIMYANGRGVPQDYGEAVRWWRRAAEQGLAGAQHNLGFMYANGRGVPQNYDEAARWYRRAAEQGHAGAQNNLGAMYSTGDGVLQDYVLAHMWFNLAASRFAPSPDRDSAVTNRDRLAARMTPAQIAEAQRLAREWDAAHPQR